MSHRLWRGLSLGLLGAACALSCGTEDEKHTVPSAAGGEGGAEPATGDAGEPAAPVVGGAAGEAMGGGASVGGEGGDESAAGVGGAVGTGGAAGGTALPECVADEPCTTHPGGPCWLGVTACDGRGVSSCVDSAPAADGVACPSGACHGGACIAPFRLFNTGVDGAGAVLEGGAVDPHYTLLESAESTLPGPDAIVATHIADGYWVPQSDVSKWIAPSPNQSYPGATPCNASGTYVYRTSFDLTGYDPDSLTITGGWAADNSGTDIRLNGVGLNLPAGSYSPLTTFTIEGGFLPGANTLDFVVADIGCPNGLRVELAASDVELL